MKLLFLAPRLPYPPNRGGEIIVFNLLKRLSARHEIALVSFFDTPDEVAHRDKLLEYCARVELVRRRPKFSAGLALDVMLRSKSYGRARHSSHAFQTICHQTIADFSPDLIQLETFYMAQHVPWGTKIPLILQMHDVTWLMWERMAGVRRAPSSWLLKLFARRERRDEIATWKRVNMCVTVSEPDRELVARSIPDNRIRVIMPGVDTHELRPSPHVETGNRLVLIGSMEYLPNVDGAQFFCQEIFPRISETVPDVSLTIVGRSAPAVRQLATSPRIKVVGRVDDVKSYIWDAAVSIVPIRFAGGVRMKILEAMALGSAIVSTSVGCEGLGLRNGRELLVADSPEDFAVAVVRLLRDVEFRLSLGHRARRAAQQRFSWDDSVRRLEDVYGLVTTAS